MRKVTDKTSYLLGNKDRCVDSADSTSEQELPAKCIGIYPLDGCVITSLKRDDDESKNWADDAAGHLNIASKDLTGFGAIMVEELPDSTNKNSNSYYWSKATCTVGKFRAITE